MGTFAPSPLVSKKMEAEIIESTIKPTLRGLEKEGCPFVGILFAGLMVGKNGPKLLEFNACFGDPETQVPETQVPETQVILPRIKSDFIDLIEAAIDGNLDKVVVEFYETLKLVCVVMCTNRD